MSKQNYDERKHIKILISRAKQLEKTMVESVNSIEQGFTKYISCTNFTESYQHLLNESLPYVKFSYTHFELDKLKSPYDMTGLEQKRLFDSVLYALRMLITTLESNFDFADDETDNLDNLISKNFRKMFHESPSIEKTVQDTLENLFIANNKNKGIDYDREAGKFMFAGREYIPDFIVPTLKLCIEVKLLKDKSRKSKLIEEINADITAYSKEYERILFVIYDLGYIRDEIEFKRDIEASGNIKVIIIKK